MEEKKKKESALASQELVGRLRVAMDEAQTNARELAENADVGRSFVYDILSGKSANPTTQKLASVANILGVSVSYLLYGEEAWDGRFNRNEGGSSSADDTATIATVAVEPSAAGGVMVTQERRDKPFMLRRSWLKEQFGLAPSEVRVMDVQGDSMAPTFLNGDTLLVNLKDRAPSPPGIFVLFDGVGLLARRLEFHNEQRVQIISDNPRYQTRMRPMHEINIIGRVIWFARRL